MLILSKTTLLTSWFLKLDLGKDFLGGHGLLIPQKCLHLEVFPIECA